MTTPRDRLKALREALGLNQRQMAAEFAVTKSAIAFWESGQREIAGPVLRLIELYEKQLGKARPLQRRDAASLLRPLRRANDVARGFLVGVEGLLARDSAGSLAYRARLAVATKLALQLGSMRGFGTKIAQMLHGFSFALPQVYRDAFSALPQPKPMQRGAVATRITEAFGAPPKQLFAHFEVAPFALASLGQVHRAITRDGREVAVKIQYPNVVRDLERDMRRLAVLDDAMAFLFPHQTPKILMRAVAEHLLAECDYTQEAKNQADFIEAFARAPHLVIPRVDEGLSCKDVLTTRFESGEPLDTFAKRASQAERNRVGLQIARFTLHALFEHGLMLGDPHPRNYMVRGKKLIVLDFGRVFRFTRPFIEDWRTLVRAVVKRDRGAIDRALFALGVFEPSDHIDTAPTHHMLEAMFAPWLDDRPFTMDAEFMRRQFRATWKDHRNRFRLNLSVELASLHELHFALHGMVAAMGSRANWHRVMAAYL